MSPLELGYLNWALRLHQVETSRPVDVLHACHIWTRPCRQGYMGEIGKCYGGSNLANPYWVCLISVEWPFFDQPFSVSALLMVLGETDIPKFCLKKNAISSKYR